MRWFPLTVLTVTRQRKAMCAGKSVHTLNEAVRVWRLVDKPSCVPGVGRVQVESIVQSEYVESSAVVGNDARIRMSERHGTELDRH